MTKEECVRQSAESQAVGIISSLRDIILLATEMKSQMEVNSDFIMDIPSDSICNEVNTLIGKVLETKSRSSHLRTILDMYKLMKDG